jgi:hypothetical protein
VGAKPFVCETSTLYVGRRSNAVDHLNLAYDHGFTPGKIGMPVIMADGLSGQSQIQVEINGKHAKKVWISADIPMYDFLIGVAHVTGHMCSGLGACLKNIGMGLASRAGKLVQHSDVTPFIKSEKCTICGACLRWCPENAISITGKSAVIDKEKCIGCGECLSVCKYGAVAHSWNQANSILQEKMAEHAWAVIKEVKGRALFVNFAVKITKNCDCMAKDDPIICEDLGILLSTDPVALDTATMEMLNQKVGTELFKNQHPDIDAWVQLRHAEQLGMGSMQYTLNTIPPISE